MARLEMIVLYPHRFHTLNISSTIISLLFAFLSILLLASCSNGPTFTPEKFTYRIIARYPHDPLAFTQGLVLDHNVVYEGTGKLGRSSIRRVDLQTGKVEQKLDCAEDIYGEGITVFKDKIYQLTWKNKILSVYDKRDFSLIESFPYPREGWGLTHDNKNLIASDGTSTLYFLDPETLSETRRITVIDDKRYIKYLNELEYINGFVYANIYGSDKIVIINPGNGIVEGWIDLSGLRQQLALTDEYAVLNGIMYHKEDEKLFVTGKFWPTLFEIRLVPDI